MLQIARFLGNEVDPDNIAGPKGKLTSIHSATLGKDGSNYGMRIVDEQGVLTPHATEDRTAKQTPERVDE